MRNVGTHNLVNVDSRLGLAPGAAVWDRQDFYAPEVTNATASGDCTVTETSLYPSDSPTPYSQLRWGIAVSSSTRVFPPGLTQTCTVDYTIPTTRDFSGVREHLSDQASGALSAAPGSTYIYWERFNAKSLG